MKLLVYSHSLEIGGSQIVAVNLASAMQARGHDVLLAGPPGPLADVAAGKGLRVFAIPRKSSLRPSRQSAIALRRVIRREKADLVHAYSHSACIEAFIAAYLLEGVALVSSARGKVAPRPFPKSLPLIVAQGHVEREAVQTGHSSVYLMRPVVDTDANHPLADVANLGERLGAMSHAATLVLVSRLTKRLKLPGIQQAIEAVALLAEERPIRLIIVGEGDARRQLTEQAEIVNRRFGRPVVSFTGEMLDPRPAYAAADIVLGMQGGLLRGMAFAKPAIVLGKAGFSELVTPDTVDEFLQDGFYGEGPGDITPDRLARQIAALLEDAGLREQLGRFCREVVCENMSLRSAADLLEKIYETHRDAPTRGKRLREGVGFSWAFSWRKLTGRSKGDRDFREPH